jgi:hypothetical protein
MSSDCSVTYLWRLYQQSRAEDGAGQFSVQVFGDFDYLATADSEYVTVSVVIGAPIFRRSFAARLNYDEVAFCDHVVYDASYASLQLPENWLQQSGYQIGLSAESTRIFRRSDIGPGHIVGELTHAGLHVSAVSGVIELLDDLFVRSERHRVRQ